MLARQANMLSLKELEDLLAASAYPLKRTTLSHYEHNMILPSAAILETIAPKLGVSPRFFHQEEWPEFRLSYHQPVNTARKFLQGLNSFLQIELEKFLELEKLLGVYQPQPFREPVTLRRGEEGAVDEYAEAFRAEYGLGSMPVSSVCTVLENNGWHIVELPDAFGDCYVSGYEHSRAMYFITHHPNIAVDEYRFLMLKTAAASYIRGEDEAHTDQLTSRFSRAVLLPRCQAALELGLWRESISQGELLYVKQKFGLSKLAIVLRMEELGYISARFGASFLDFMYLHGYPRKHSVMSEPLTFNENTTLWPLQVLRAQEMGLITPERAGELTLLRTF